MLRENFSPGEIFFTDTLGGKCECVILLCWPPFKWWPGPNLLYLLKKKPNYDKSLYLVHFLAMDASSYKLQANSDQTSNGPGRLPDDHINGKPLKEHLCIAMLLLHLHIFGGFVNAHAPENTFALLQLQTSASVSVINLFLDRIFKKRPTNS